jgi:hypothetical protein
MSVYRCDLCDNICDADFQGICENPLNEHECICESCSEEFSCFFCGEFKKDNKYCKITDQYYCEECV